MARSYRVGSIPRELSQIALTLRDTGMGWEQTYRPVTEESMVRESFDVFVRAASPAKAIGLVALALDLTDEETAQLKAEPAEKQEG